MKKGDSFERLYKGLNKAQKEAVDTIEGPVMVIAGPGTGKTQVIALRIGNILSKTDTPADGVLCLTFTNSGVSAMKKRLSAYGIDASKVAVYTFHSFGTRLIEEFYPFLGLSAPPQMLDEADAVGLVDDILNQNSWEHLRPRSDAARYFRDLKSLVSLLIREGMSPEDFAEEIERDIHKIKNDPDSLSSRGARKGELKREAESKIEALERSREVASFYQLYEEKKKELNVFDYDDILRAMVRLASEFEDVRAALRERHLYVLVDEHQDSSGVQNEFLKQVWGPVEKPNVFVVGDDRQLIYGFSGASLSLFESFREEFPGTKLITLTENYRSTQTILDAADALLSSLIAKGKLSSNTTGADPVSLVECAYERDEILRAGIFFKEKIKDGTSAEECALLVPKNYQVRSAIRILEDLGLECSAPGASKLFEAGEFSSFLNLLKTLADPYSAPAVANLILDSVGKAHPLEAHRFLHKTYGRELSVEKLASEGFELGERLLKLIDQAQTKSVYDAIQLVGEEFFLKEAEAHHSFVRRVEVVRSLLHLALSLEEKTRRVQGVLKLADFVNYLERLREYGQDIPLAIFGEEKGIRVMTLHGSKGLEFEAVWIAHMTERALMGGKRMGLSLPERLKVLEEKKDLAAAKREVYVALTRAKHYANLSYALMSHSGGEEELAFVIEELPKKHYVFEPKEKSEEKLLEAGIKELVVSREQESSDLSRKELEKLVGDEFASKKVSATTLNNFFECPWKWYFRSFLDVPEPQAEALTFGSVVHGAIENILKREGELDAEAFKEAVEEALDYHHVYNASSRRRMMSDALRAVKRFSENLVPELYDEKEVEKPLSFKDSRFPELSFTGKIDLLEHDGGGSVRVTDFKTGRPRTQREIEKEDGEGRMSSYRRQLAMYSYLLSGVAKGKFEVEKSRLYFVESERADEAIYETVIGADELGHLLEDVGDYQRLLKSGEWSKRECQHVSRPNEPECPYCLKAKMYR